MKTFRIAGLILFLVFVLVLPMVASGGDSADLNAASGGGILRAPRWSPYAVGIGIGILSWLAALLSDNRLGASSAYLKTSAMIESALYGDDAVMRLSYYRKNPPQVDWGWMLLAGVVLGAMLSALLSGSFHLEFIPPMWEKTIGQTPPLRWFTAIVGGILLSFGARWAGGCTSGHGISGSLQLAASSWLALLCFFVGGALTARVLY